MIATEEKLNWQEAAKAAYVERLEREERERQYWEAERARQQAAHEAQRREQFIQCLEAIGLPFDPDTYRTSYINNVHRFEVTLDGIWFRYAVHPHEHTWGVFRVEVCPECGEEISSPVLHNAADVGRILMFHDSKEAHICRLPADMIEEEESYPPYVPNPAPPSLAEQLESVVRQIAAQVVYGHICEYHER